MSAVSEPSEVSGASEINKRNEYMLAGLLTTRPRPDAASIIDSAGAADDLKRATYVSNTSPGSVSSAAASAHRRPLGRSASFSGSTATGTGFFRASPEEGRAAYVGNTSEHTSPLGAVDSAAGTGFSRTSRAADPAAAAIEQPPVLPSTRISSEVEPPKRSSLVSVDSSSSNMFLTSWEGSLPWYNYDPTKGGDDLRQIIKASGYLTKQGNVPDLKKRSINGAILTYNKERGDGSIDFIDYKTVKGFAETGASTSEKAAALSIKLKTDRVTEIDKRTPVVSLLSKGDALVGICKSTCANSGINKPFLGGDDKSRVRIICAKNEKNKVVKILFFPSADVGGQNIFFDGEVRFNEKGEYLGPDGKGSLLRKRDNDIHEVITGSFQGDRIIKHEDLGGTFSQYTNNGAGNYRLVGMASGNVSWEFKFPLTKEFNPNKQNLTFVNWNFGDGVKNIAKPDIYAHKSKSDRVLCTAFDVNDGRFMFVTKQKYNETENDLIKDIVGTLLKFKFTRNSETFCIELILNDSAVSGDDISETELENVAYLRVYTLNTTTTVTKNRRGFFSNQTDDTVHKKILAIKMKGGNITSMGLSTVSAANDDIGTQPRESYGKIYTLDDKTGKKWEIVDSVSKTFPFGGQTIFNKCDALQARVKGDFEENIGGVNKCYSMFYRDDGGNAGVFKAAVESLANLSATTTTTPEHKKVYAELTDNINIAKVLTEEVLKAAWNTEKKIRKNDVEEESWNFGKWSDKVTGVEPVMHPADVVVKDNADPVSERPLEVGSIAQVSTEYTDSFLRSKLVYLTSKNRDTWEVWRTKDFNINESELTSIMSKEEVLDAYQESGNTEWDGLLTRLLDITPPDLSAVISSRTAAADVATAAVTTRTLEQGGIAMVNGHCSGKESLHNKHVYLSKKASDGIWETLRSFAFPFSYFNIDEKCLTLVLPKASTGNDSSRIAEILAELDRAAEASDVAKGGRRGTRKYRGRRGNGANMRRRLTRKAKGQAGGGGRRGSGSGGRSGSKRRGGKMYRKTMKHVRRGRGGRKGRKGHRRTIKKYHRR